MNKSQAQQSHCNVINCIIHIPPFTNDIYKLRATNRTLPGKKDPYNASLHLLQKLYIL